MSLLRTSTRKPTKFTGMHGKKWTTQSLNQWWNSERMTKTKLTLNYVSSKSKRRKKSKSTILISTLNLKEILSLMLLKLFEALKFMSNTFHNLKERKSMKRKLKWLKSWLKLHHNKKMLVNSFLKQPRSQLKRKTSQKKTLIKIKWRFGFQKQLELFQLFRTTISFLWCW